MVIDCGLAAKTRLLTTARFLLVFAIFASALTTRVSETQTQQKTAPSIPASPQAPTTCTVLFADVHTTDYFYDGVRYLFCMGAMGGYQDNTFRPANLSSRGQLSKVLVLVQGWPLLNPQSPTFRDVPRGSTFYQYVETAYAHGVISGYADGTFHPGDSVLRGQLVKMIVLAAGWPLLNPPSATFNDVPPGSPFYQYVETANAREIIAGYADGTFRPSTVTTRGQIAKVVYYADTSDLTLQEQTTINLINQRRTAMGLVALRADPALHRAGLRHSADIGPLGLCQHEGTDGSSPWDRAAQAGYTSFAMGEVVGCGYTTPLAVVDGWWASPGHYAILTDPSARDIGCGWWLNVQGYGWQTCLTGRP
jgi:uncharacterized protein YkwD